MTIAIGILVPGSEDIVFAADTQQTDPQAKTEEPKIMTVELSRVAQHAPRGCLAFTGAGNAGYLDSFGQRVVDAFARATPYGTRPSKVELLAVLQGAAEAFYQRHVIPFGERWVKNDGLDIDTIFGYQLEGHSGLFVSSKAAIHERELAIAGSGQNVARAVLASAFRPTVPTEAALRLAAFAVHQAKEHDPYCGKHTQVALLRSGGVHYVPVEILDSWDGVFRQLVEAEQYTRSYRLGLIAEFEGIGKAMGGIRQLKFSPSGTPAADDPVTPVTTR